MTLDALMLRDRVFAADGASVRLKYTALVALPPTAVAAAAFWWL